MVKNGCLLVIAAVILLIALSLLGDAWAWILRSWQNLLANSISIIKCFAILILFWIAAQIVFYEK